MSKYIEILPMNARDGNEEFIESIEDDPNWKIGEKIDGHYLTWQFYKDETRLINSSGDNKIVNTPHFDKIVKSLKNTFIVVEGFAKDKSIESAKSIFGSFAEHSIDWQSKNGKARLRLHDVLVYKGEWLVDEERGYRRKILHKVYKQLKKLFKFISIEKLVTYNKLNFYHEIIKSPNGEGVMAKDMRAPYIDHGRSKFMYKIKPERTYDFVVIDFTMAREGKFEGLIGAIVFGAYDSDGELVEWGKSSGMKDDVRIDMTENRKKYIGMAVEFKCKGLTKYKRLRFPQFSRLRPDKKPTRCLISDLDAFMV